MAGTSDGRLSAVQLALVVVAVAAVLALLVVAGLDWSRT